MSPGHLRIRPILYDTKARNAYIKEFHMQAGRRSETILHNKAGYQENHSKSVNTNDNVNDTNGRNLINYNAKKKRRKKEKLASKGN